MAAGLGFKTFTTGEVLTAADVNGYLMQGVLVFASAAARNAAITSPQEGQFAFTKDTNGLWYYDGAAWVASGATGDIEGVTAGVGITGGGTSGTVTITNDMATTITAAGDIVVGTGSGTYDNLPIGTTNQILTADTTVSPYKVKWATPASSSQSFTLLNSGGTSLSGSSTSVTGISGMNSLYVMVENASSTNASSFIYLTFNNDTTAANYSTFGVYFITTPVSETNLSAGGAGIGRQNTAASGLVSAGAIINGCNSTAIKVFQTNGSGDSTGGGNLQNWQVFNGIYSGTSTISSVQVRSSSGTFDNGKVYIYGSA